MEVNDPLSCVTSDKSLGYKVVVVRICIFNHEGKESGFTGPAPYAVIRIMHSFIYEYISGFPGPLALTSSNRVPGQRETDRKKAKGSDVNRCDERN